jgi:drug/metabolite transporter (DMT)-like permease
MVKKKPVGISPVNFLFIVFSLGTILVFPFYLVEINHYPEINWTTGVILSILYLGLGASVICFLIWNIAIHKLGAGRTAIFGTLIPVFSSIEAAFFLNEAYTMVHLVSMLIVFAGIVLANLRVR